MCLWGFKPAYVHLVATRVFDWVGIAGSDGAAEAVEILILRYRLVVGRRRYRRLARKLAWAGRAWLALSAGLVPVGWFAGIGLFARPGTLLLRPCDLLRRRRARHSWRRRPGLKFPQTWMLPFSAAFPAINSSCEGCAAAVTRCQSRNLETPSNWPRASATQTCHQWSSLQSRKG